MTPKNKNALHPHPPLQSNPTTLQLFLFFINFLLNNEDEYCSVERNIHKAINHPLLVAYTCELRDGEIVSFDTNKCLNTKIAC